MTTPTERAASLRAMRNGPLPPVSEPAVSYSDPSRIRCSYRKLVNETGPNGESWYREPWPEDERVRD